MLQEVVPYDALCSHKHYFNNNKPSAWMVHTIEKEHLQQQVTEGVKLHSDRTPPAISRAQESTAKTSVENMTKKKV